eukprot:scaffold5291_cov129-Isochrysis_galbana.AAC.1
MLAHTVSLGVGVLRALLEIGEGHFVVLHRGHDVGERRCLPTVARRVRNPHRSFRAMMQK